MTGRPSSLTAARMRALAEAYGSDLSRWPADERDAAQDWIAAHPSEAGEMLSDAAVLDDLMDAWRLPQPADTLRARVLVPAPAVVREARRRSFLLTLGGGAGLAAACLAGILAAPALVSRPAPAIAPLASVLASTDENLTDDRFFFGHGR